MLLTLILCLLWAALVAAQQKDLWIPLHHSFVDGHDHTYAATPLRDRGVFHPLGGWTGSDLVLEATTEESAFTLCADVRADFEPPAYETTVFSCWEDLPCVELSYAWSDKALRTSVSDKLVPLDLQVGAWIHLCMVWDPIAEWLQLYANGTLLAGQPHTGYVRGTPLVAPNHTLTLSNVRFKHRTLNANEIAHLHHVDFVLYPPWFPGRGVHMRRHRRKSA